MNVLVFIFLSLSALVSYAQSREMAVHLVTYQEWGFRVDESEQGLKNRDILNEVKRLGFDTVILNFRGHMITEKGNAIRNVVAPENQKQEMEFLEKYAAYAQSLGLKVAIRPILLVVGPKGQFPWVHRGNYWWHGNIEPTNVDTWFESYFKFHEPYLRLAQKIGASWYSIGAEMHSMTSGLGERHSKKRFGHPGKWVSMIQKAKAILGSATALTYGINYTDQYIIANKQKIWGGELEQWRHDISADFKDSKSLSHQKAMRELWAQLDVVGIDYYRALGSKGSSYPRDDFDKLVVQLLPRAQSHASQLDTILTEIMLTVMDEKPLYFQEVGYRSVEKTFLDPSSYESDGGKLSHVHQAAAWETLFQAYWQPNWPWMRGFGMWQILVDDGITPSEDKGFTPLNKPLLEGVLRRNL